jgi:primosomal protein N' (replication factor Y) (superfamily II helicase)
MVRKKWIAREDLVWTRATLPRTAKIALLRTAEGKLNSNQQVLIETLAAAGGRIAVENLQALEVPKTTLATLVKRGLVEIVEEPVEFMVASKTIRPSPLDFQLNSAQQDALKKIEDSIRAGEVFGHFAARRHRVGQDCGLSCGHALGARGRTLRNPSGS